MCADKFIKELSFYLDQRFTEYDKRRIKILFEHNSQPVVVYKDRIIEVEKEPVKNIEESIDDLIGKVCNIWGVDLLQIKSKSRKDTLIQPRYFIFCLLKESGMKSTAIGEKLNRDHSTVLYGIKQAKVFLEIDYQPFASIWKDYKNSLQKNSSVL